MAASFKRRFRRADPRFRPVIRALKLLLQVTEKLNRQARKARERVRELEDITLAQEARLDANDIKIRNGKTALRDLEARVQALEGPPA